jgi:hypothetical protein
MTADLLQEGFGLVAEHDMAAATRMTYVDAARLLRRSGVFLAKAAKAARSAEEPLARFRRIPLVAESLERTLGRNGTAGRRDIAAAGKCVEDALRALERVVPPKRLRAVATRFG